MRWFFGTLLVLVVGVAAYLGSAIVSLGGLVEAARAGDGAAVLARTDTVRLRRSLVDQIVVAYLRQLGQDRPVKPWERLAANTYGASIADAMIAKMLTAENLTAILNKGTINSGGAPAVNMLRLTEIDTDSILCRAADPVLDRWQSHFTDTGTTLFLSDRAGAIVARRASAAQGIECLVELAHVAGLRSSFSSISLACTAIMTGC